MTLRSKKDLKLPDIFQTDDLPDKLRHQIFWVIQEHFIPDICFIHIHKELCKEHGIPRLAAAKRNNEHDVKQQIFDCLIESRNVALVLDTVQLVFQWMAKVALDDDYNDDEDFDRDEAFDDDDEDFGKSFDNAVDDLNRFFLENGVGFEFDKESNELIPFTSRHLYQEAVRPALHLLTNTACATANGEFLQAFEHFKKGEYGDCLTECCKSVESTLKILCKEKGWTVDPKATFQPLLKTYLQKTGLDAFWEQPLVVLATLRNKFDAHGAGDTPHEVSQHVAQYALNATGSAIIFLVKGAGL